MKHWTKWLGVLLTVALLFGSFGTLAEAVESDSAAQEAVEEAASLPEDNLSVTQHSTTINGKTIDYTATAGTMVMSTDFGQYEIFYTAYTVNGVEDMSQRPLTFAFNGGPGSASLWLHMGLLGPQRINVNAEGKLDQIPVGYKPNPYSILDLTDLVFIDPVGTGYSRPMPGTPEETFYSLDYDCASVAEFIRLYISRNDRWASPRYLAGESYGTTRAVGVCEYLSSACHMSMNGLMLISSANDYAALSFMPGNEIPFVNFLPTYAATAWYHGRIGGQYRNMTLEEVLDEARAFAAGDYLSALYQGTRLTDARKEDIASRMADLIGLDKDFILQNDLRISMDDFCPELLADLNLMVGRFDSRYTGPIMEGDLGTGSNDPSSVGIMEAFSDVCVNYLSQELKYKTDRLYESLSSSILMKWNFNRDNQIVAQEQEIYNCMSGNQFLKVWVLCGYYDLATPFFGSEWIFSHIFLNPEQQENLSFTYYSAGHMFYMLESCIEKFHNEAEAWYTGQSTEQ